MFSTFSIDALLTVTFTLFAVIDIIGSIPLLISLKEKMGGIGEAFATGISGALMLAFFLVGEQFLGILGLDVKSFAVGGSIVIFLLGLEMVLGHEIFKSESGGGKSGAVVPIAFPIIAGSGTLTTIMSLKANYEQIYILLGILNLLIVYGVMHSLRFIERVLGKGGLMAVRKFFGVILLAIAVKIFSTNLPDFGK